jgi:hypothetical protein
MRQIVPVHMGDTGPKVTNLHVGLVFLIGHQGNLRLFYSSSQPTWPGRNSSGKRLGGLFRCIRVS